MKLGKIDYLNLLPFDVFLKKSSLSSQTKAMIAYKKSYPAKLNRDFLFLRIDMGFLSSIMAYGKPKLGLDVGIVARGEVWSVLALPKASKGDYQSASSNALIQVLGIEGEVLIGDRALVYKLQGGDCVDLGEQWWQKKKLPFVFGLFCANFHRQKAKKLAQDFVARPIKIPYYLLKNASSRTKIDAKDILQYLQRISYSIGHKEKIGLKQFYRELLFLGIKKPKRF